MSNRPVRHVWSVDAEDRKGKSPRKGKPMVLADDLLEALKKAQDFLDKRYGRKKFKVVSGEYEGTIDVF